MQRDVAGWSSRGFVAVPSPAVGNEPSRRGVAGASARTPCGREAGASGPRARATAAAAPRGRGPGGGHPARHGAGELDAISGMMYTAPVLRLLLADADLRATIAGEQVFLHQQGCRIVSAADARELVGLARLERPHLIIVDADRFRSTIDTILIELRRIPALRGTPLFATTARWRESLQELLLGAGADALLAKPVGKERLYELVKAAGPAMALDIRVPIAVEVAYLAEERPRTARLVNLSRGGLFLEAADPSPAGTRLTLSLSLPAFTNPLRVTGVVAWVNDGTPLRSPRLPRGMGVKFVETPVVTLKTIALYVMMSKNVDRVT